MKKIYEKIWELALPYQDQRDDPGHAEVALHFAQLLVRYEQGDRDTIIPAIILHDVGYSQIPKERRMLIFAREAKRIQRLAVQYEHQIEGIKLAKKILEKVSYPSDKVDEILEIISQHDTRKGFISKNEGLVRDADKLWRYSKRSLEAGAKRAKARPEPPPKKPPATPKKRRSPWRGMAKGIDKPDYFYSERARKIAHRELNARKREGAFKPRSEGAPVGSSVPNPGVAPVTIPVSGTHS